MGPTNFQEALRAVGPWQAEDTEGVRHQGTFVLHIYSSSSPGNSSLVQNTCGVSFCTCVLDRLQLEMEPGFYFSASNTQPIFSLTVVEHYSLGAGDYAAGWRGAGLAVDNCGGITARKSVVAQPLSRSPGDFSMP